MADNTDDAKIPEAEVAACPAQETAGVSDNTDARGRGRPTKNLRSPAFLRKISRKYAAGLTDAEIAYSLGIGLRTLYRWKAQHPEIRQVCTRSQQVAIERIEASMYMRAVGFEAPEVTVVAGTKDRNPRIVTVMRYHPPDMKAAKMLLAAWAPEANSDRVKQKVSRPYGKPIADAAPEESVGWTN